MTILIFLLIIGSLVLVHEFGHFITAKKSGIRVEEFGIGFPPRIVGLKYGETLYSINLIPFGGFVRIFGEDPEQKELSPQERKVSFAHKHPLVQGLVIAAGILFNFLFAWVLLTAALMSGLQVPANFAGVTKGELVITSVLPKSPAEVAGLASGDILLFLRDEAISLQELTPEKVSSFIAGSQSKDIRVLYQRGNENFTTTIAPKEGIIVGRRAIGISMDMLADAHLSFFEAVPAGLSATVILTQRSAQALFAFFGGLLIGSSNFSQVTGPVGLVGVVGDASRLGFVHLLFLAAGISIQLAVVNVIPFPALDGGRLLFLFIETIKGSPIRPSFVRAAHGVGFILLLALMFAVTWSDIVRLI